MRKVCVFTGTRAEYGLLKPVMEAVNNDNELQLQVLVSGMHLAPEFGYTVKEIEANGFKIDEKVEMLTASDTTVGICKSMSLGLEGYAVTFSHLSPDILILLGDRFEAFTAAAAATVMRLPIAHIHGGEATHGVTDEAMRHAMTKMSHLHFASTETYRRRIIQMGEHPDRVHNVGALGVEKIRRTNLPDKQEMGELLGFEIENPYILVTYHPVTLEKNYSKKQFESLLQVLEELNQYRIVFTFANADAGGKSINKLIKGYCKRRPREAVGFASMGQRNYLGAMSHAAMVLGNSSSGIIEAPSFGIPTLNVGDRQKGRIRPRSVLDCEPDFDSIREGITRCLDPGFREQCKEVVNPYEKQGTSDRIVNTLKGVVLEGILKKVFYDLDEEDVYHSRSRGEP